MSPSMTLPALPFPLSASHPDVWRYDAEVDRVVGRASARTDLYVDPTGAGSGGAETLLNAATLLGTPPAGDFQLQARVQVDFASRFDAGVLLLWVDERTWAKFCFELSPAAEPMVVSVVTRGLSDDANAFTVADRSVWFRVARVDGVYAFHASTDARTWQLVRVFSLGERPVEHRVGFEAQSPTGEGCTVTFDEVRFTTARLVDLRDGS